MPRYGRSRRQPRLKRRTARAVLNTTSIKKSDTLVTAAADGQNVPTIGVEAYALAAPSFFGSSPAPFSPNIYLWCPTQRPMSVAQQNASVLRTSSEPYYRGLKENITIRTNSPVEWQWRRIVFTLKGGPILSNGTGISVQSPQQARLFRNISRESGTGNASYPLYTALLSLLFRGGIGVDYTSVFTARTDTSRVSIMYDKTMNIKSGNQNGRIVTKRFWHPINKTLYYNDNENADTIQTTNVSTVGKPGMGDMYVLDLVRGNGAASDILAINSDATLYWHEK